MEYRLLRFEKVGKYFKQDKALDATIKQIREEAKNKQTLQTKRFKEESNWGIRYEGINKYGDLVFSTNSQSSAGRYTQHIRFYDFKEKKPRAMKEILDMLRESDVGVSCNDPSFLYWGGAHNATKNGYNIFVETRGLNDPHKETKQNFVVCKHLIAVLHAVPFWWNNIISDYRKYFNILEEEQKVKQEQEATKQEAIKQEEVAKEEEEEEIFTEEDVKEAEDFLNIKKEGDSDMNRANNIKMYKGSEAINEVSWRAVFEAMLSYVKEKNLTDADIEKVYINDGWLEIISKKEDKIASGKYLLRSKAKLIKRSDGNTLRINSGYELVKK